MLLKELDEANGIVSKLQSELSMVRQQRNELTAQNASLTQHRDTMLSALSLVHRRACELESRMPHEMQNGGYGECMPMRHASRAEIKFREWAKENGVALHNSMYVDVDTTKHGEDEE
jgi:hypothetical protein